MEIKNVLNLFLFIKKIGDNTLYRILAIDYANMLYRSYWSVKAGGGLGPPGLNILRFFQSLYVSLRETKCNKFIFAGESYVTLNRTKIDPNYKAQRKKSEDLDFVTFSKTLNEMLKVLNMGVVYYSGFEGDDVIAGLCKQCSWDRIYIMSMDKDLRQLLRPHHVYIVIPDANRTRYTYNKFVEEFGFGAERYYIYKSLVGDTSDNIRGVEGIGPVLGKEIVCSNNIGETLNNILIEDKKLQFNKAMSLVKLNPYVPEKIYNNIYSQIEVSSRQIRLARKIFTNFYGEKLEENVIAEIKKVISLNTNRSKIIAVDFDGTLVEHRFPEIGKINEEIFNAILEEQNRGCKIILWTCREGEDLERAVSFCKENGLVFDGVNENLDSVLNWMKNDSRKIFADEYWDDRGISLCRDKRDHLILRRM